MVARTISYNFSAGVLARALVNGLSLAVLGIMIRHIGAQGFGYYSAVMAYLFIFVIVADMGLQTLLVREISREGTDEASIISRLFTLRLVLVITVTAIANIVVWWLPYPSMVKVGVVAASLFVVFSSLTQVLVGVFQKHLRAYMVSLADVITRIVQLGLVALLVWAGYTDAWAFLAVVSIAELVHFVLVFLFAHRILDFRIEIDYQYWRRVLKTSFPIAASLVFTLLYFRIDTIFLSFLRSPEEVGIYSVAYKILELTIFVPALYVGLVMPILSRYAPSDRSSFRQTFERTFENLVIMALPMATFLLVHASGVARLVGGADVIASYAPLQILTIAIVAIFFGNLGGHAIIALDLQKKGMWIYFAGAILNIVTNAIFIPAYGIIAASWTTVLTELIVTISLFVIVRRAASFTLPIPIVVKATAATMGMTLLTMPFKSHVIVAVLLALTYFPLLYLVGGIKRDDVRSLIRTNYLRGS